MSKTDSQLLSVLRKQSFELNQDLSRLYDILPRDYNDLITDYRERAKSLLKKVQNIELILNDRDNSHDMTFLLAIQEKIAEQEGNRNDLVQEIKSKRERSKTLARVWEMFHHDRKKRAEKSEEAHEKERQAHIIKSKTLVGDDTADLKKAAEDKSKQLKEREQQLREKEKELEKLASQAVDCPNIKDQLLKKASLKFNLSIADMFYDVLQEFRAQQIAFYTGLVENVNDSFEKAEKKYQDEQEKKRRDAKEEQEETDESDKQQQQGESRKGGESKNYDSAVRNLDRQFLRRIINFADRIRQNHFDFLTKKVRKSLLYINQWNDSKNLSDEEMKKLMQVENIMKDISREAKVALENLANKADKKGKMFINRFVHDTESKDDARILLNNRLQQIPYTIDIIQSYYQRGISWLDLFLDRQFMYLYAVKIAHVFLFALSVYISTVIFKKKYQRDVFEKHKGPPTLYSFMGMIFAFFIALNVFVFLLLILFSYLFQKTSYFSFLDTDFIYAYVVDLCLSLLLMLCIFMILTHFVSRKRYFNYKYDGYKTIYGLGRMLSLMTLWIVLTPFFYFYWIIAQESM